MPKSSAKHQYGRLQQQRKSPSWLNTLRLLLRLVVTGVGLAILTGTVFHRHPPSSSRNQGDLDESTAHHVVNNNPYPEAQLVGWITSGLGAGPNLADLEGRFRLLAAAQPDVLAGAYVAVLETGHHASLNPDRPTAAASSIKTPLLLLALLARQRGELRWNETLGLQEHLVAGGSGWMGAEQPGSSFPLYMVAREMITVSDNTATNLLLERLGGIDAVNRQFLQLRLHGTRINNWLPDLDGTNTTTARDLAMTLALAESKELLSLQDRDRFRAIHGSSRPDTLLPQGFLQGLSTGSGELPLFSVDQELIDRGVRVLNKTGDIGTAYVDTGIIELPNGYRAVAAFLVEGTEQTPYNSPRMRKLIQDMAAATATALEQVSLEQVPSQPPSPHPTNP